MCSPRLLAAMRGLLLRGGREREGRGRDLLIREGEKGRGLLLTGMGGRKRKGVRKGKEREPPKVKVNRIHTDQPLTAISHLRVIIIVGS